VESQEPVSGTFFHILLSRLQFVSHNIPNLRFKGSDMAKEKRRNFNGTLVMGGTGGKGSSICCNYCIVVFVRPKLKPK
jgi:hypothetical protein